jgi:hypothetical protein
MKKVVLMGLMLSLTIAQAQEKEFDTIFGTSKVKRVQLGFNLGGNYSWLLTNDQLPTNARTTHGTGFQLGVLSDIRLTNWLYVSPKAELAFNKASVDFVGFSETDTYEVFPVSLEFKNHFIFKKNYVRSSPYFLIGPAVRIPIQNKNKLSTTAFSTRTDLAIDFGIGLDNRFSFFNFAPELRYSFGLLNINAHPQLQSIKFHKVALVFNFKG